MKGSGPFQGYPDVARHPTRKVDDLEPDLVAPRLELPLPEFIHLLRQPGERVLPARLQVVIDRPPAIGAESVRKAGYLDLRQAILDRSLDDRRHPLERLLVGDPR